MVKKYLLAAIGFAMIGCGGLGIPTTTVQIGATPLTITNGQSTTLAWQSIDASSVVSSNFGASTVNGTKVVSPGSTTTYTITVQSSFGGTATSSVTVNVQ